MDFNAEGILARMKADLKNEDSKIEGSFSMDNLQSVAEEVARLHAMRIVPLMAALADKEDDMGTSGNERHYIRWAKEAVDAAGNKIVGNARVSAPRDGTGNVYIAIVTANVGSPTEEEILIVQEYINSMRPVGANPIVSAAESVPIQIMGVVSSEPGYTSSTICSNIKKALAEYLTRIAFQSATAELNYFTVNNIIGGADGVQEIHNLTVNGEKESVTIDYNKYFSLEGLQIDVIE